MRISDILCIFAFDEVNLNSIVSLIEYPNKITSKDGYYYYEGSFSLNTFNNATLYVPKGTVDKYKTTEGWKDFLYIREGSPSGIHNVEGDGANEIQRYTLDGRLIKNSHKGINIIKMKNGTTNKVLVK